jgi:hypothetical protein
MHHTINKKTRHLYTILNAFFTGNGLQSLESMHVGNILRTHGHLRNVKCYSKYIFNQRAR